MRVTWRWFAVVVALFVCLGAVVSMLMPVAPVPRPVAEPLGRATARLGSADLDERLVAIQQLELLMWRYDSPHQPAVMTTLSTFVRERASRCGSELAKDIDLAMTVLGRREISGDDDTVMDLHDVCLSNIELANNDFQRANLSGADLTGAVLVNVNLDGADLTGARLTGADLHHAYVIGADLTDAHLDGTDVSDVRWSDETSWPSEYEQLVLAATTFGATSHVIGELRLPDRQ
jgi:uncharacterized protein YjbI with pentapeptide repeats